MAQNIAQQIADAITFTGETFDYTARNYVDTDVLTMSRKMVLSSILYRLDSQISDEKWGFEKRHDDAQRKLRAALPKAQAGEIGSNELRSLTNAAFNAEHANQILLDLFAQFAEVYADEFGQWEAPKKTPERPVADADMADVNAKLKAMGLDMGAANVPTSKAKDHQRDVG